MGCRFSPCASPPDAAPLCLLATMLTLRLFVYGSLKRGFSNHDRMRGACFAGVAVTASGHELFLVGEYPALVTGGAGTVSGEVYEVTPEHLLRLDAFEDHPHLYCRTTILLSDGTDALAYTMGRERVDARAVVCGGLWLDESGRSHR